MTESFVQYAAANGIATLTLNRPESRNAVARRIAVNPAKALRLAKRLLREGQQQRLSDVLELSAAFQALAHETKDHEEAVAALLEKREPRFTGQ